MLLLTRLPAPLPPPTPPHPPRPPFLPAAVASTQGDDGLSYFSNYGPQSAHLAAPGQNVLSTFSTGDASYAYESGTSMATPLVSGAAALLKAAAPWATAQQIK